MVREQREGDRRERVRLSEHQHSSMLNLREERLVRFEKFAADVGEVASQLGQAKHDLSPNNREDPVLRLSACCAALETTKHIVELFSEKLRGSFLRASLVSSETFHLSISEVYEDLLVGVLDIHSALYVAPETPEGFDNLQSQLERLSMIAFEFERQCISLARQELVDISRAADREVGE